eukprot:4373705-Amphidinium_carterae.1
MGVQLVCLAVAAISRFNKCARATRRTSSPTILVSHTLAHRSRCSNEISVMRLQLPHASSLHVFGPNTQGQHEINSESNAHCAMSRFAAHNKSTTRDNWSTTSPKT